MLFDGIDVGTVTGTLLQTPQNYTFNMDALYISNKGTAVDTLTLNAVEYDNSGAITGTLTLGIFSVASGINSNTGFRIPESVPAGSYLTAISVSGNIQITYSGDYAFYRD